MTEQPEEFLPIPEGPVAKTPVPDDPDKYGPADPKAPNSVLIKLGKKSFVSWQSDNPIAVLALLMMTMLVFALLVVALVMAFANAANVVSLGKMGEVLGQAILTIVGAIIGSSAAAKSRKK